MNIHQCLIIMKDNRMNPHSKYEKILSYKLYIKRDMIFCPNNFPQNLTGRRRQH